MNHTPIFAKSLMRLCNPLKWRGLTLVPAWDTSK